MENLAERIRRVIADLRIIQELLKVTGANGSQNVDQAYRSLEIERVKELKGAVDDMRMFLWSYFEDVAKQGGKDLGDTLQAVRMQRTTEMLNAMREDLEKNPLGSTPDRETFFDALQSATSLIVDRHMRHVEPEK